MSNKVFVRGVSERVGEKELEQIFSKCGRVEKVQTGQAGFAFVEMENESDCYEAIRALDGTLMDGQKIMVEKARGKEKLPDQDGKSDFAAGEFRCYNCNRPGHMARDCAEKPRNPMYVDTRGTRLTDIDKREGGGGGSSRSRSERFHPYSDRSSSRGSDSYSTRDRYDDRRSPPPPRDYDRDRYERSDRRSPPPPFHPPPPPPRDYYYERDHRHSVGRSYSPDRQHGYPHAERGRSPVDRFPPASYRPRTPPDYYPSSHPRSPRQSDSHFRGRSPPPPDYRTSHAMPYPEHERYRTEYPPPRGGGSPPDRFSGSDRNGGDKFQGRKRSPPPRYDNDYYRSRRSPGPARSPPRKKSDMDSRTKFSSSSLDLRRTPPDNL